MFDPISEDDTVTNSGLGMWKPYIFQYYWIPQEEFNEYWDHDTLP